MLNISNRLCNPTPFRVVWPYDKGVMLTIEADGYVDLPADIMDDFRADKPGADAVKLQMDQYGIFLRDPTRPYEHQAADALAATIKSLGSMYDDAYANLRRRAAQMGSYDEKSFKETLRQNGYENLKEKVEILKKRLGKYQTRIGKETPVNRGFDPERTLIFLDPPKEFDSKVAMEIFLEDHPELKAKHEAYLAAQEDK